MPPKIDPAVSVFSSRRIPVQKSVLLGHPTTCFQDFRNFSFQHHHRSRNKSACVPESFTLDALNQTGEADKLAAFFAPSGISPVLPPMPTTSMNFALLARDGAARRGYLDLAH
ncbi:MAG TPA: hypothetical protein PLT57_05900, partial [Accumulibacter sp.]|nr:hypothetical protein [Accumulibacter sp.]